MKTNLMCVLNELTFSAAKDSDIKRENANIDGDTAMGTMLKYGSVSAKEYYEMYVLEKAISISTILISTHLPLPVHRSI